MTRRSPAGLPRLGEVEGPWVVNRENTFCIDNVDLVGPDLCWDITKSHKDTSNWKGAFEWVLFENLPPEVIQNRQAMKNAVALSKRYVAVCAGKCFSETWGKDYMTPCGLKNVHQTTITTRCYMPQWYVDELLACSSCDSEELDKLKKTTGAKIDDKFSKHGKLSFLTNKGRVAAMRAAQVLARAGAGPRVQDHDLLPG